MYIKLDCFNFSTFDLRVKVIEIFKYILPFSWEKPVQGQGKNYLGFRKILVVKIVPVDAIEKQFESHMQSTGLHDWDLFIRWWLEER